MQQQGLLFRALILGSGVAMLAGLLFVVAGPVMTRRHALPEGNRESPDDQRVTARQMAQPPDSALEEEMYRIADKLNCPICQGQRLSECPIQICQEMRAEIIQRLREGQTEEEIIQAFVDRYGIQALNQPPVEGFNILAWVMPFVGLAVVLVIGGWVLRQWSRRRATVPVEAGEDRAGELPEEYLRRLQQELEDYS